MIFKFYKHSHKLKILWCLLLTAVTPLQAKPLLTLTEVVQRVLTHNFDIQIARNKQKIAAQNHHAGKASFLPLLDANLGLHQEHEIWPQKQNTDTANLLAALGLKWTLFNGMQHIFTYQHLEKISQIYQLAMQQTIEEKVAEAIKSYYRLALAQKRKHVLENCLAVSEEVLRLVKAKYEVGQCSKLDYLNAQVQHNEEQANLLLQEEKCTAAKLALQSLLSQEEPADFTIVEDIPLPSRLNWEALTEALAVVNTTSVRIAQKRCEDATLAIKLKQADLWPSVDLFLGYTLGKRLHEQCWETRPGVLKYGISISFNIFHALQHTTAIQEARIELDNAQLSLRVQRMELEATLEKHFLRYTQQLKRCELAQQHVNVSQENVAAALAQYRLGSITLLALEKARQNDQEITLKRLQAIYDAKVTEVELQKLGGTLLNAAY